MSRSTILPCATLRPVTDRPMWTVTTWNLQGSEGVAEREVGRIITATASDVVVVQEVRRRQARAVAHEVRMHYAWTRKHHPHTWLCWWTTEGAAILTPHVLDRTGSAEVSDPAARRWRGRRWDWRRRIVQWAVVERDDDSVRVFNVHLSPHDFTQQRLDEALRITAIAATYTDGLPNVLAGDFNDADDPAIIDALPGVEHVTPGYTNPSSAPSQLLDHVLVPDDACDVTVDVPAGGAPWAALSDHLPVTVRFRRSG